MRWALVLVALAACGGNDGAYCVADADCTGGDVCARTHECLPPDQIHSVKIHWTIGGQTPSTTACSPIQELEVGYSIGSDQSTEILFAPVMCIEGAFPNDRWPIRYDTAVVIALSANGSTQGFASIPPDPTVDVTIDVAPPP